MVVPMSLRVVCSSQDTHNLRGHQGPTLQLPVKPWPDLDVYPVPPPILQILQDVYPVPPSVLQVSLPSIL